MSPDKVPQFNQTEQTQARVLYQYRALVQEILECCAYYNPVECPECYGGGFEMKCYGGSPVEERCEFCYGEGIVEDWSEETERADYAHLMAVYQIWKAHA
jgi:hypothetical protein